MADERPADEMASLYELFTPLNDEEQYRRLLGRHGLDVTAANRMTRTLRSQLAEQGLQEAVYGRNPNIDPNRTCRWSRATVVGERRARTEPGERPVRVDRAARSGPASGRLVSRRGTRPARSPRRDVRGAAPRPPP
jgi:hypothetical protein